MAKIMIINIEYEMGQTHKRLTEMLHWMNPSDTICPASVAVILAL